MPAWKVLLWWSWSWVACSELITWTLKGKSDVLGWWKRKMDTAEQQKSVHSQQYLCFAEEEILYTIIYCKMTMQSALDLRPQGVLFPLQFWFNDHPTAKWVFQWMWRWYVGNFTRGSWNPFSRERISVGLWWWIGRGEKLHGTSWDICDSMGETGWYDAKWNQWDTNRQILHDLTCKWNLK